MRPSKRNTRIELLEPRLLLSSTYYVSASGSDASAGTSDAAAFKTLQEEGELQREWELRPVKYLNNMIEQDHRFIKRRTNPGMGFWSFDTASRTLQGYEATNQLRKGQVKGTTAADIRSQIQFVWAAFALVA